MGNFFTKRTINIRMLFLTGAMAMLIYVYAIAHGLTLPWQGQKDNKKTAVLHASTQAPIKSNPTPTATATPTPAIHNITPQITISNSAVSEPTSNQQTKNHQKDSITIELPAPNGEVSTHIEFPHEISVPGILEKVEVKVDLPIL